MNEKSRLVIRIVAGLYVDYTGFQIIRDVLVKRPGNMMLMMAAGIFFLVAGTLIVISSLKGMRKLSNEIQEAAEIDEDEIDEEESFQEEKAQLEESEEELEAESTEMNQEVIDEEER